MIRTVVIGAAMAWLAAASPLAQDRTARVSADIEQISGSSADVEAPPAPSPTEPHVTQLTQRAQGALSVRTPPLRAVPDLPQLTRHEAGVGMPAPPAGAVDLCSTEAEPPPGLDCAQVLEAVAASAPPETRLLEPSPTAAGEGGEVRVLSGVNADQVAQRLQSGDLAGSPVAQAVAAARGDTPPASSLSPTPPDP